MSAVLVVIAEGIETPGQHAQLKTLGCDFGQGYLFGRPQPAAKAEALLIAQYSQEASALALAA